LSKGLIQWLKFPGKLIHDCSFFHSRSVSGCDEIPKRAILRQQQHDDNDDDDDANTSNDDEKTLLQSCKQQPTTTSDKRIHSLMFTNVTTVASRVKGKVNQSTDHHVSFDNQNKNNKKQVDTATTIEDDGRHNPNGVIANNK